MMHYRCIAQQYVASDTIQKLETVCLTKLELLYTEFSSSREQYSYLKDEKLRYQSNREQLQKIAKQEIKVATQIKQTKATIDAYEGLLTRIHRIPYCKFQRKKLELIAVNKELEKLKNAKFDLEEIKLIPKISPDDTNLFQSEGYASIEKNPNDNLVSTKYENLFSYTEPNIESYFVDKDFVTCDVRVIQSNKSKYLELRLKFASSKAAKIYGSLSPNNPIKLSFISSDFIYLKPINVVNGVIEEKTGHTIYKIQVLLDKEKQKKLQKEELDQMIFIFDSGPEAYDIFHFNVIKNMLECLKKN